MLSPLSLKSPQFAACSRSQVRFGHEDGHSKPETPTAPPADPKKKGGKGLGLFVGTFLLAWAGLFGTLAWNFFSTASQVNTVLHQENPDSIAKMRINVPVLRNLDIDITESRHVKAGGVDFGSFTSNGEAFTADGRRIGHVDADGNLFSVLMPGSAIGRMNSDSTINLNYGPVRNDVVTLTDANSRLTATERAAAALVVIAHPDNMRR